MSMITAITPQLRTTDLEASLRFYTEQLGFELAFNYQGFYAGLRMGDQQIHLKLVDQPDPSIPYVDEGGHLHLYLTTGDVAELAEQLKARGLKLDQDVHDTAWSTREIVLRDNQGHTLYFGQAL
ncbi:VOC family protein [Pelomonas sp. SE-A7]|uniref:VOC family protein n=1 Tax=Pelomonas sp. SE-A7 TaxID=3054953 RepID=UPI00259C7265|nr:VOC family protein [Pelomonas sp. SE-A7]MDM4766603.1 VOC family protein [Pelomonas sp. SE-A7]